MDKECGYSMVCEAKTKKEMKRRFALLMRQNAKTDPKPYKERRRIQLSNVGYFSGYYDTKVMGRVRRWLLAKHPVFG